VTNQYGLFGKHVQQFGLDIFNSRGAVPQIVFGGATESSVVVENGIDWLDQSIVNRFAFGGDDRHAQRFAAFRRVAHLAIQRVNSVTAIGRLGLPRGADESS